MRHTLLKLNTRLLALAMAAMLLLCAVPAVSAAEASGTCGDNLNWSLSGDTLTITGSGAMYDYPESTMSPWHAYRKEISTVRLPDGLTRIGNLAFYDCSALAFMVMPDSVKEVGWHAFTGCTAMTMLDLSSGLQVIEEGGFRGCTALRSVRLPKGLTTIGYRGFYRCQSLTEITVPVSVTNLGASVFAFCGDLVRANVQAPITRLPDWTFYGCSKLTDVTLPSTLTGADEYAFYNCTSLSTVVYTGNDQGKAQITEDIDKDLEGKEKHSQVSSEAYGETSSNDTATGDENGVVVTTTTTAKTENASFSSRVTATYTHDGLGNTIAQVDVTLETAKGWSEVSQKVTEIVDSADKTNVDIYIKDNSTLAEGAFTGLMGKNVTVTVRNATGSVWKIDCRTLAEDSAQEKLDLSYERIDATQEQLALMGCTVGYQIKFLSDAQVNAEVLIKLPVENARKNASFYHTKRGEVERLQTVVVDDEGYAHFYLASVDRKTQYLIGIDVPSVEPAEAIIPEVLHEDYGVTNNVSNVEYVVTGRKSSWGMDIKQVTLIMVGVMVSAVIVVGFLMFALNKRKLKRGCVPDLEDEDL